MLRIKLLIVILFLGGLNVAGAAELRGRVVDANGQPVVGATIKVTAQGVTRDGISGEDGAFVLVFPGQLPDQAELAIAAPGFKPTLIENHRLSDGAEFVLLETRFTGVIEVTGTRARAGETPVTFTDVTREEIEQGSWGQDVPIFLSQVPGFYATNDSGHGIGYSYFTLRGFDMRRTAMSLNGVPLNDATSHAVFFIDLADFLATTGDIQVQRGVGTNLFGGSAIGGSVDLMTRKPLPERRLRISTMFGSWGTKRFSAEYDTGLVDDRWAATFRWSRISSDGYRDQSWVEMWNYYATVEHYGERSHLRLVLFGGPEDTHLAYEGVPKPYLDGEITGDRRRDRRHNPLTYAHQTDHFFQPHQQLIHTWQIHEDLVLLNTLYYFEGDGHFEQYKANRWFAEYDLEPFAGPDGETIDTTDLVRQRHVDESDGGWIPQLEWTHGRGTLLAGAAIRLHQSQHWGQVGWAQYYPPDLEPNHRYYDYQLSKRTIQPFVQEIWHFDQRWTLFAGLTWTTHRYQFDHDRRNRLAFTENYSLLLPRLGLNFRPAPGWSLFANISRGGREPAFRDIYDPQDYWGQRRDLDEEKLTDYELGAEHRFKTGFAKLNLYWLHFDNEIVWAGGIDDSGVPVTANGAVADHRGAELELAWTPRPGWGAQLAVSYGLNTFAEFREYGFSGEIIDHSGNRIAGSPDWLASLQLTGAWGPADLLLSVRHGGRFFVDSTENLRKFPEQRAEPGFIDRVNDSHIVVDGACRIDLGRAIADLVGAEEVLLDLRINNLGDELFTSTGYMDGSEPMWIPAATRSVYAGLTFDW